MVNVILVRPIPLMMLISVVLAYKNGQIQESVIMKLPAIVLLKRKFPINLPEI